MGMGADSMTPEAPALHTMPVLGQQNAEDTTAQQKLDALAEAERVRAGRGRADSVAIRSTRGGARQGRAAGAAARGIARASPTRRSAWPSAVRVAGWTRAPRRYRRIALSLRLVERRRYARSNDG